jgi:hypothetical protein
MRVITDSRVIAAMIRSERIGVSKPLTGSAGSSGSRDWYFSADVPFILW